MSERSKRYRSSRNSADEEQSDDGIEEWVAQDDGTFQRSIVSEGSDFDLPMRALKRVHLNDEPDQWPATRVPAARAPESDEMSVETTPLQESKRAEPAPT